MNPSARLLVLPFAAALMPGRLAIQSLLPLTAASRGGEYWETAHLVAPYAAAGIIAVALEQLPMLILLAGLRDRTRSRVLTTIRWFGTMSELPMASVTFAVLPMVHLLVVVGVGGSGVLPVLTSVIMSGLVLLGLLLWPRARIVACTTKRAVEVYRHAASRSERRRRWVLRPIPLLSWKPCDDPADDHGAGDHRALSWHAVLAGREQ
ncbi:hypothetical protein [Glutamicibacter creatinolyticus]|uniref:hypothetical protein n=1 Tax=Glutamicibacter creatinolyticus TaxID=162496 RepID=UPI0031CFEF29